MLLRTDRLIAFSDLIMVVAIVLLVSNLATLAATKPEAFQGQTFFSTLATYVASFIVISFYWAVFTTLLGLVKDLDDIVFYLSLIFLLLVTLIPVGNVAGQQLKSGRSLLFISLIEISTGLLLLLIFFYVTKGKIPQSNVAKRTMIELCVFPSVYAVTLFVSFLNFTIAQLLTFSVIPVFVIVRIKVRRIYPTDDINPQI
ncbi:MAG TPA: TMEM175 family protein [Nitrososphaeraceae archaeon]|nr:TMEM175 family protein [Nitrososphaeraceae archaeon]